MERVRRRQLKSLRHIENAVELKSDVLLGRIYGTRARGRKRTTYMDWILGILVGGRMITSVLRRAR